MAEAKWFPVVSRMPFAPGKPQELPCWAFVPAAAAEGPDLAEGARSPAFLKLSWPTKQRHQRNSTVLYHTHTYRIPQLPENSEPQPWLSGDG